MDLRQKHCTFGASTVVTAPVTRSALLQKCSACMVVHIKWLLSCTLRCLKCRHCTERFEQRQVRRRAHTAEATVQLVTLAAQAVNRKRRMIAETTDQKDESRHVSTHDQVMSHPRVGKDAERKEKCCPTRAPCPSQQSLLPQVDRHREFETGQLCWCILCWQAGIQVS